jgi:two-component system response regulator RegX3
VHVKRLRAKVETDPSVPKHLVTVRGLGYKFET